MPYVRAADQKEKDDGNRKMKLKHLSLIHFPCRCLLQLFSQGTALLPPGQTHVALPHVPDLLLKESDPCLYCSSRIPALPVLVLPRPCQPHPNPRDRQHFLHMLE